MHLNSLLSEFMKPGESQISETTNDPTQRSFTACGATAENLAGRSTQIQFISLSLSGTKAARGREADCVI